MLILDHPDVELESDKKSDDPMKNFIRFLDDDGDGNKTTLRQYPKRLKYFFDSVWTKKKNTENEYEEFVRLDASIDDQSKEFVRYSKEKGEAWVKGAFDRMVKVQKARVEKGEIVEGTII